MRESLKKDQKMGALHGDVRRQNVLVENGGRVWRIGFVLALISEN
mgnify:FL=1